MKRKSILIVVLFFISLYAHSQVVINSNSITSSLSFELLSNTGQNLIVNSNLEPNLEGSPFLREDWQSGYIIMKSGDTIPSIELRYNVYKDEMHFKAEEKVYSIGIPEKIKILLLGESPFIYLSYKDDKIIRKSFFEILNIGKSLLLKHHYYEILPANYNLILNSGNKNKQLLLKKKYYLRTKEEVIVEIDKRGERFISAFGNNGSEIEKYVKDNKLSFKEESDLIQITNFANSLN